MYTALYRKWRPLSFSDVISQSHITDTLQNQIKNSKTAHAYLFTGSRGTGKTTCARILAKAVNCLNPSDGNPCLECEICRNAELSALTDIIEIDAASNNGVDDIRDIREAALYMPEQCRYKVYIIDEVHMLSQSAFNALLKIMEEPPSYIRFILATTEIHKVPATILSRCQRFDFRRIKPEDISARLMYIAQQENINLQQEASDLIAGIADGGMRDAVSLLDQCSSFGDTVTPETVYLASGTADRRFIFDIIHAAAEHNPASALEVINTLHSMSKDMQRLAGEITLQFRNIMLIKTGILDMNILSCMNNELNTLKEYASQFNLNKIISCICKLQDCSSRMNKCISKRTELEMCIINICTAESIQPQNTAPVQNVIPVKIQSPEPPADVRIKKEDFSPVKNWADIMNAFSKVNPAVNGALAGSKAFINHNANAVLIMAENPFFITLFKNNPDNRKALEDVVQQFTGKRYTIMAKCTVKTTEEQKNAVKLIEKASHDGITVESEN